MAAQGTTVLADLGRGWLQCQDNLGVFYFNQTTQQSSEVMPPELSYAQQPAVTYASGSVAQQIAPQIQPVQIQASQPQIQYMPAAQPQVQVQYVQQTPQAQPQVQYIQQSPQAQPVQYAQQTTQAQPQVQYVQQAPVYQQQGQTIQSVVPQQAQQVSYTPAQMQYVQQPPVYQPQGQIIQPAVSQQAQATVKLEIGDWCVCEDSLGEFYHHTPSQQSFDQAPAQLVALIQASQRPQVQIASTTAGLQAYGQQLAGNVNYAR